MSANSMNVIVEKIAKNIPVDDYTVEYGEGNEKGEGYLGEMIFVKIKSPKKTYDVAVKRAFTNQSVREDTPIRDVFLNEMYFYKDVYPVLRKLQSELDLPKFDFAPKCYLTSTEPENEYLAMENLKISGFELIPKENIVPYDHIEMIFKAYANLHATSIILRELQPENFKKITSNFKEVASQFFSNPSVKMLWSNMFEPIGNTLIPGKDDEVIAAYKQKYSKDGIKHFMDSWEYHGDNPVINHGDCWSNNMMFKYNSQRELVDLKILDWQILKIGSPAHDLSYCLYSGASKETFDKLEDLLKLYYKTFSDILLKGGLNPEEIYPYSLLKKEWKEYSLYGWLMGTMIIKLKMTNQEDKIDLIDLSNSEDKDASVRKMLDGTPSQEFDNRIRELLLHVHEIGAL